MQTVQGTQALIWTNIPATQLRREIRQQLRRHQSRIEQKLSVSERTEATAAYLTRSQRAHRRLAWAERLKRNASRCNSVQVSVSFLAFRPSWLIS